GDLRPRRLVEDDLEDPRELNRRDPPGTNPPPCHEVVEGRPQFLEVEGESHGPAGPFGVLYGGDLAVQEEHVHEVQTEAIEALVESLFENPSDVALVLVADMSLREHPHPFGQATIESLPHHALCFPVAVGGGDVDQCDARIHRLAHRGHRFLTAGGTPHLADAAATERQGAHRPQAAEHPRLHLDPLPSPSQRLSINCAWLMWPNRPLRSYTALSLTPIPVDT